jgi:hypothetical protein
MKLLLLKLKNFTKLWPELWALPLGIVGLYWSYFLLWLVFPFAAPYPPEVLQKFLYAGYAMLFFNGMAWLGIRLNLFGMYEFYKTDFSKAFKKLRSWQKISFLLASYFGLLHFLVALAKMI